MAGRQRILPVRRDYNRWVANQTLEDYALRFTAKSARRWSAPRVAQTAIGAISFLALEAIGGAITLAHGFVNAAAAIVVVSVILLLTGRPIARQAARSGVDIDLLTRGAGFGYIGSTVTSLVYASFTFILFAIEASIMSSALELAFGWPLWVSYILSALAVIPLVVYGITTISRFQLWTQPFWIVLNIAPFAFIAWKDPAQFAAWWQFGGVGRGGVPGTFFEEFDLVRFGLASSVILALMPQIGEQVDFLRFLPERRPGGRWSAHRIATFFAGEGWIVLGLPKLFAGSLLAVVALRFGVGEPHAAEPAYMYDVAFSYMIPSDKAAVVLTAAFVVVSQLKINVMNAYAGSLAWSNFFSRVTHSHPGRVVWLIFNVAIALLLMELGIYEALERTLGLFAIVAVAWLGAITADLAINKPLGLAPPGIEFKRAHLYDVNPVGVGSMGIAAGLALVAATGLFGELARAFAPFVALAVALVTAPLIAWATGGRFYLARRPQGAATATTIRCSVCEHAFEPEDTAHCPAYDAPICSLCCSLDARCRDLCKPEGRVSAQARGALDALLPRRLASRISPRLVEYVAILSLITAAIGLVLLVIHFQSGSQTAEVEAVLTRALWAAFFVLLIVAGVVAWFFVLAHESRRVAEEESARQTSALLDEIAAHERTDAELQKAKEAAEAANTAKSRYLVGLSHELRTPLNAVMGYAQVLERDPDLGAQRLRSVKVIRRSAEHLSGLIDGLLDISKIESGRLELSRDEFRFGEFLDGLVEMFRPLAEAKGLAFRFTRPTRLPEVVATDEKRLRQVLTNLLTNAIKFTERGEVHLDVAMRHEIATFTVTDTGRGISEAELPRIFEPFERGEGTRGAPGLGLGLTITKMLATLMGGDVRVDSRAGEGSRFRVRMHLSVVNQPTAVPPTIWGHLGPRRTVMVVDDNAEHRDLVRAVLEPVGFSVLEAADGSSCLRLAGEIRPDLFLIDISMPGMDGWTLARRLREAGFQAAKIVILSANVGESRPPEDAVAAHDDVVAKPFDMRRLLDRIQALLGLEWSHVAPSGEPAVGPPCDDRPTAAEAEELLQWARIGYVRGVASKLAAIAAAIDEAGGSVGPRLTALERAASDFDMPRLIALLETRDDPARPDREP